MVGVPTLPGAVHGVHWPCGLKRFWYRSSARSSLPHPRLCYDRPTDAGSVAPEQMRYVKTYITIRIDLFALAEVMYEAITSSNRDIAIGRSVQEVLDRGLKFHPPRVRSIESAVPSELDDLINRRRTEGVAAQHP
jgi:hypothetical protein